MRLSLCNEVLREMDLGAQCAFAAALGYDGLEIAPFTLADAPHELDAAARRRVRRMVEDAGLAVTSLHWLLLKPDGLSLTDPDPDVCARTKAVMEGLCGLAADLGATTLVHGSPKQRALTPGREAEGRAWAGEAFAAAARAAEAAGVTYCIEPLARNETNYLNTVAEAAALVDAIGSPHLRTMLDTSAAGQTEDEPLPDLIARHVPSGHIAHVQVNDPNRRGPGEGAMAFGPIFKALRAAGYAGDVAVEPFVYVPNGPACAARAIGYLRGVLEGLDR